MLLALHVTSVNVVNKEMLTHILKVDRHAYKYYINPLLISVNCSPGIFILFYFKLHFSMLN